MELSFWLYMHMAYGCVEPVATLIDVTNSVSMGIVGVYVVRKTAAIPDLSTDIFATAIISWVVARSSCRSFLDGYQRFCLERPVH